MPTILVVDDQPSVVRSVSVTLERWGDYDILEAADGETALALARQHHPDMVILDVMMPGMDGFQVLDALKADPATRDIAVLMITARDDAISMAHGLEHGADYYLPKPFQPREMATIVQRHFDP